MTSKDTMVSDMKAVAIDSWAGRMYVAVEVIGETPARFRVRILDDEAQFPHRRLLKGDVVLVPKDSVVDLHAR